jgi:hypothetical protein
MSEKIVYYFVDNRKDRNSSKHCKTLNLFHTNFKIKQKHEKNYFNSSSSIRFIVC